MSFKSCDEESWVVQVRRLRRLVVGALDVLSAGEGMKSMTKMMEGVSASSAPYTCLLSAKNTISLNI